MLKTIFHDKHELSNAKMVDFEGWNMPISYPSGIIKEAGFVRKNSGFFDVSHMGRIEILGDDRNDFIEKIFPIDLDSLKLGSAKYTLLINENNQILDDLIIYKLIDRFLLVINASNTNKDLEWIYSKIKGDVRINNITSESGMLAIQGPEVINKISSISNSLKSLGRYKFMNISISEKDIFVARTGYTGEDGFEIIFDNSSCDFVWNLMNKLNIPPCGLGARDLLRIEAGLHLYGHEIQKNYNPIDIGLERLLETKNKSYINYGYINSAEIKNGEKSIVGFFILDRGMAREGNEIFYGENIIGSITSGTYSPTLNGSIAIGIINQDFNIIGNKVRIKVRDKFLEAEIKKLPFYRRKKKWVKFLNP